MRHTIGLLILLASLTLVAIVFAVIGFKTGSSVAWCITTGASTLLVLILLVALDYLLAAIKYRDRAKDRDIEHYRQTSSPGDSYVSLDISPYGHLNREFLLQELGTQINTRQYLSNLP